MSLTLKIFCFVLSAGKILRIGPHWDGVAQSHCYLRADRAEVVLRGRGNQELADTAHEFIKLAGPLRGLDRRKLLRILLHQLFFLQKSSLFVRLNDSERFSGTTLRLFPYVS